MRAEHLHQLTGDRDHRFDPNPAHWEPKISDTVDALNLRGDTIVVELGCGQGAFTIPIASALERLGDEGLIFGFDLSSSLIEKLDLAAEETALDNRIRAIALQKSGFSALPIRDEKVDRVLAVNVLPYLDFPAETFREIKRVLKPTGTLVVVDWHQQPQSPHTQPLSKVYPADVQELIESYGFWLADMREQPEHWIITGYQKVSPIARPR